MSQERARRSTAAAKNDPYTLIVALDGNMHAEGDIYLDDGSSFAYQRGVYAHRAITFSKGVLSNRQMPGATGKYDCDLVIERIIVVGLDQLAAWSVVDTGTGSALEAGSGPLVMQAGVPDAALVVRKPDLPVAREWSVTFAGAGKAQTQ